MAELGNLTPGILLCLWRLSTVKIRTGGLFPPSCTPVSAAGAALPILSARFPPSSTGRHCPAQDVHSQPRIPACARPTLGCKVEIGSCRDGPLVRPERRK